MLGVTTPNFALTVFPLGHKDIDGLVGMNFLRHFNSRSGRPIDISLSSWPNGEGRGRCRSHDLAEIVEAVGVISDGVRGQAEAAITGSTHQPAVIVRPGTTSLI